MPHRSKTVAKDLSMRIAEKAAATFVSVAAQFLIIAAVMV